MFYVLVEIANYRQISRLRAPEVAELRDQLEHFSSNRGGRFVREQNGFFLFSFHPQRERVLHLISDFLFLTCESLVRKQEDLFGFNLLLECDEAMDDLQVFGRLKGLLFGAARENAIWAGPLVTPQLKGLFPVAEVDGLTEILGPPQKDVVEPLTFHQLLEMTGWIEALEAPLAKQLPSPEASPAGKIIRLKGTHLTEKIFVLRSILQHIYGSHEDFPVVFPLDESHDFLTQLLIQVDADVLHAMPQLLTATDLEKWKAEPPWEFLLTSRGAGEFPGDSSVDDVSGALSLYYRAVIRRLSERGIPPIFLFLSPQDFEETAVGVLEEILTPLVTREGLMVLILEHGEKKRDFLGRLPSLTWSFPALSRARILKERDARGWTERFPHLPAEPLALCADRGASFAHYLGGLQEKRWTHDQDLTADPTWSLLCSLDASHRKVYLVFLWGRALLDEDRLVAFFQYLGEDPAVIRDKVEHLKSLGFLLFGANNLALRTDFQPLLREQFGREAEEMGQKLGEYVFAAWNKDRRLSEVVFQLLHANGQVKKAMKVLSHYITHKINRGEGDFLPLLRPALWESIPLEDDRDQMRQMGAAFKLRYALNQEGKVWRADSLEAFRRFFTPKTEMHMIPEWLLQQGRFHLRLGDLATGFPLLKRALLAAQEQKDPGLEIRANTEIGLTLLRKRRLEEGREYFEIASRLAEKTGAVYSLVVTMTLDATSLFLLGHLSTAVKVLDRLEPHVRRSGMQRSRMFVAFLRARLEFDRGDYAQALTHLEAALETGRRYEQSGASEVLHLWKGRCEAYSGNTRQARSLLEALPEGLERNFYLAEAHYFDRNPALALEMVRRGLKMVRATQPFAGEGSLWTTGYAALEDRVLGIAGEKGVLEGQAEAFMVFLEGQLESVERASARFQSLLAQKSLLELDVTSAQYYFLYYLILPRTELSHEALRLTLLGRALKDIQTRSSRIEDPQERQEYLHRPYWNAQYLSEGKKLKLV